MRKLLFLFLFFASIAMFEYAWGQDNLLAVDVIADKDETQPGEDKPLSGDENISVALQAIEGPEPHEDSGQDIKKIKAYRELLENKQKELEVIKIDLEKSNLLLRKKEAEKEIYEIDKSLPQGRKGFSETIPLMQEAKESVIDISDIKIQLLLISDDLKEGIITLRGAPYGFKEGDCIASKLTVEQINPSGVRFRQPDGNVFNLNFIN